MRLTPSSLCDDGRRVHRWTAAAAEVAAATASPPRPPPSSKTTTTKRVEGRSPRGARPHRARPTEATAGAASGSRGRPQPPPSGRRVSRRSHGRLMASRSHFTFRDVYGARRLISPYTYSRPLLTGSPQCKEDSGEVTMALELEFVKFISFFCPLALPSLRRLFWPVCQPVCASVSFCVFVALFWSS